nr:BTAD domain-containing putative transcriptional regulator [uncultured Actinoplanes sp.]
MRVRVLGQLTVTADDGTELPAGELPRRARQVLAVLAARHGRIQSKDALADAVWGDDLPGNHVAALEHYVSVIRRRLQPNDPASTCFIVTRSGGYVFDTGRAELDLADLRRRIRDLDALPTGSPERLALHEQILELAGELPFPEDPYADWASSPRSEVQVAAVTARLELAAAALPANAPRSLRLAQEAIELNPFLEPAYRAAMCAAVAMDRADDALRLFERLRKVLDDELGVAPSPEIIRLHREIMAQRHQPEPERAPLPPRTTRAPERFLGREAALRVLVEPDQPQVVHIVGPDGAGKSAFLDELARRLAGRVGIGHGGSSIAVHRLAWLRAALVQLGAASQVLAVVDGAVPDRPLGRDELELIGAMFDGPDPVIVAVDDAVDLDTFSVAELSWLSRHYPSLRVVLTYCYPSQIVTKPLAGLGTPVVMRLEPLTAQELAPFHDAEVVELTGGIPALVAVARRLPEIRLAVAMQTARARTRWMPEPAWDVLRFCAVLGPLDAADLAVLTGRPMPEVLACIDRLVHAHLLREDTDGLVGHRSSLIRDAVADQVSGVSSRALRERLAASSSR